MPLKQFLMLLVSGGLVSWLGFVVVITNIDPGAAGMMGIVLFYATFGCGLFVLLTLIGLAMRSLRRRMLNQPMLAFKLIGVTLRQAAWCSIIAIISLILAANGLFNVWSALALVVFFSLLEGFLFSLKRPVILTELPSHETQP